MIIHTIFHFIVNRCAQWAYVDKQVSFSDLGGYLVEGGIEVPLW